MVSMHAEPKPQDALLYPNYYDGEWLGSSADRLRIHVRDIQDEEPVSRGELRGLVRRPRDKEDGPILLDEFRENVVELWAKLKDAKPKISDSHIRNFETLMQDRRKAWAGQPGGESACLGLAAALIRHYFPKDLWEEATQAYEKGFLPLTLKLYLHILKERLGEKDGSSLAASA